MVGMMAAGWGERAASLLNTVKSSRDAPSKMEPLRQLKSLLLHRDPSRLPQFLTRLVELKNDPAGPVRKFLGEMIGDIGLKHTEFLPELVACLILFLNDETPAVARQAIITGTLLFRCVLQKVAIQGLYSSAVDDSVHASWLCMLNFKSAVLPMVIQSGTDGVRLLAIRFVETLVLLFTPDPNSSSDPPQEAGDGSAFNISWLKGGHPLLNLGDLTSEASQNLGLLLDQLRLPQLKTLSNSIVIVLINSLSSIANQRPSFYGRILSVLLSLDPSISVIKSVQVPGAYHALKNAFVECLKCTHSSAEPWRARLVEALNAIDVGEMEGQVLCSSRTSGDTSMGVPLPPKVDEESGHSYGDANSDVGRKRSIVEERDDSPQEIVSVKKIRQSASSVQEISKESSNGNTQPLMINPPAVAAIPSRDKSLGPVQQLVGMFGALVAQGEKATTSLEILISSISSDLLAEVVIANTRYLPPTCPKSEVEEDLHSSASSIPVIVSDLRPLLSLTPLLTSLLSGQPLSPHDIADIDHSAEEKMPHASESTLVSSIAGDDSMPTSTSLPVSVRVPPVTANDSSTYVNKEIGESHIPGLDSLCSVVHEPQEASHASAAEFVESIQEHATSLGSTRPFNVSTTSNMSSDLSETQSCGVVDASQTLSAASLTVTPPYVLPKMALLDANLTDADKDNLQIVAFSRILEAHKTVAVSGGSDTRFSLLCHLGIEFPLELNSWELLQNHVLSDFVNLEGHELTLRLLYRLYRETEQDQDFLSSRTAVSVYESFLLAVAKYLRDTFPPSDKSLGKLLVEVPYLSEGVLKLLECLCSPERSEKLDKDFQGGDRVTQGLSAVWNLILLRPSNRDRCLQIALQSAVHPAEDVRMKAIRLVANKLFPMPSISQKIEDFANDKLQSVTDAIPAIEPKEIDVLTSEPLKDTDLVGQSSGEQKLSGHANSDRKPTAPAVTVTPSLISEAQRCMSLYFALCTKKHSLLRHFFSIYKSMRQSAKEAVHGHIPILVRTVGSSPELLRIISDPPVGSENLLMQVVQTLTDGTIPSQDLISSVRNLYNLKLKDVEILIPVLPFLSQDEILPIFPKLVGLPPEKFQAALSRVLQGSTQAGPSLAPAEVLIAIHGIDPDKDGIPLKKIMDACSACFEQKKVFTQQVLAKVLNQLVEQIPLPLLFMRTVIQAIGVFPALVDFVMEILSRLVNKQIWKYPKLWVGFLKCAIQTMPQSFTVLLQLPAAQLEQALTKNPILKAPLVEHASQPNIRSTLPRSTLVVLGLVQDPQPPVQVQASSQSPAVDTSSSAADVTDITRESTPVS